MSADNGIYVVKFPEGYRISHAQAIENIDCYPVGSDERNKVLKDYFGESKLFDTIESAMAEASSMKRTMEVDGLYLEYGICYLGVYESFEGV